MAYRRLPVSPETICSTLREHAALGYTPERSATELGISLTTLHRYRMREGIPLVIDRRLGRPPLISEVSNEGPTTNSPYAIAGSAAAPGGDGRAPDPDRRPCGAGAGTEG